MEEEVPPGALGRECPSVPFLRAGERDAWELAKASHGLGTVGRPLQVEVSVFRLGSLPGAIFPSCRFIPGLRPT